ncbi:NAD(P)H-binding protein [Mycolicibacterium wolinskyi]|uniref:Nucleoside-diphosphate sugar epimerase n=1 Tax=Mycolicibacterium wolinskyi TaxID=59750 RepID=A0A1X2EWB6_9MYCO|nr:MULTISPECIES: NAD(P)H-binding protein [Mycolicibacterium]MCV7286235.1 NAD(P)H-binding protein [Mycolicibacterium wolinskyi]MCV7293215.1 NAD(P)H-binding protein [Mycolicibacterium goodii]ORX10541.1 nucleoside-diphosphate sugar epimerase [Mycolicibacterium wolinskyi]
MNTTILVTGSTGNVGRPLVSELVNAGARVRAVTRNPQAAAFPPEVELVESVAQGIPGATAVFLNSRGLGDELAATIDLARTSGVRRLVALSAINADEDDSRQPSRVRGDRNRETEQLAVASGLEWVSLRPTYFASNFAGMWSAQIRLGDVVSGPYADASLAPIADADISAVAAVALLTDELVGQRIPLTGPEALTNTQLVAAIGSALGRPLHYQEVPADLVRKHFVAIGFAAEFADGYLALMSDAVKTPALVTHEVDKILGRRATTFAEWASHHSHLFTEK